MRLLTEFTTPLVWGFVRQTLVLPDGAWWRGLHGPQNASNCRKDPIEIVLSLCQVNRYTYVHQIRNAITVMGFLDQAESCLIGSVFS